MKEIGRKLKEAREEIGVSIEEVAEDLKLRPAQIENIENGDSSATTTITITIIPNRAWGNQWQIW